LEITNHKKNQAELKRILKMVTPSSKVHQDYLNNVEIFINNHNYHASLVKGLPQAKELPIKKLKIVSSQIFNREYLVAYANTKWFKSIAPNFDAAATQSISSLKLDSPPLVIIPESSSSKKNDYFLSIIEHEFVHVNQCILKNFPETFNFSDKPISELINYMMVEYQANYIQYGCFPKTFEEVLKGGCTLSMPDWSILRGYTQALEKLVQAIYLGQLSPATVKEMLKMWPEQLPSGFKKIGLQESSSLYYVNQLPQHLLIAINPLMDLPHQQINDGFRVLTSWISAKLKS
jgi:hypothetical protein